MILSVSKGGPLEPAFDQIGLGDATQSGGSLLVKINLSHPPEPDHPRTDADLLVQAVRYAARLGARCAVAESAEGFLGQNLEHIGVGAFLREHQVHILDLDDADVERVTVDGEAHYLPKCLRDYAVRVGIPATSKFPDKQFSGNVKLFVGAVPRRMYWMDGFGDDLPRPRLHVDLHGSVARLYRAVMSYAPFGFFVNGGRAMVEGHGLIELDTLVGDDALDMDVFVLRQLGLEPPEYIARLAALPAS